MVLAVLIGTFAYGLFSPSAGAVVIAPTVFTDEAIPTVNGNCTLREAVEAANTNATVDACAHTGAMEPDTINLATGTYELSAVGAGEGDNLTGDIDVDTTAVNASNLTIDGAGAGATTIDTDDTPEWGDRVLEQISNTGTLTISDLTITDGHITGASGGGGFKMNGGTVLIERSRITGSSSDLQGGGVSAPGSGSLSITDSTIDANTSTGNTGSGGVYSNATTTTVDSTVIRGNTATNSVAPEGGGMEADSTTLTMTDSVIADNHLIDSAGADAILDGGGLMIQGGSATIRGSTFNDNDITGGALHIGGGIFTTGFLTLINSTLSGNEALGGSSDGGGLFVNAGTTSVIHTTFGPNPVADSGSAIFNNSGTDVNLFRSVIETSGAAAACGPAIAEFASGGDNVVTDTTCMAETGNDDTDADPMLGLLMNNGGPSAGAPGLLEGRFTHLPAAASTVVDHVPAANCRDELNAPLLVDQRGESRPKDGDDADTVADCEAGSVEIAATPPPPPPPAGGGSTPIAQPTPASTGNPECDALRAKLKKAKSKRKKKKIRAQMRKLGC